MKDKIRALDCGGKHHPEWSKEFKKQNGSQSVHLFTLPTPSTSLALEARAYLKKNADTFQFILDDGGFFAQDEDPIALLELLYDSLSPQGEAWIKIPQTIWVFQEDQHRIALKEYLLNKWPSVFRSLPPLPSGPFPSIDELSEHHLFLRLNKTKSVPQLKIELKQRSLSYSIRSPSLPVLEYQET